MIVNHKRIIGAGLIATALGVPVLIGGNIADQKKYPAIIRISASGSSCTAAVVGPNAVLTAAHCVKNGGTVSFKHISGKSYTSGPCKHHEGYGSGSNATTKDFALCKVTATIPAPYASINTDHNFVKVGDSVMLTGYGCIKKGGGGGNDGYLRIGEAKVTRVPTNANFDIVAKGTSALCFGDSGGPAFKGSKIVGVNSRGNINDTSYLSAVHMADESYMLTWAKAQGVGICGLNRDCGSGGGGGSMPEPKPNPIPESMSWWEKLIFWIADLIWGMIWR